jgi:hypothetical protein
MCAPSWDDMNTKQALDNFEHEQRIVFEKYECLLDDQSKRGFAPAKVLEDEDRSNGDRADRGSKAIMGWRGYEPADEADISDLVADLMHYCHKHRINFEKELCRGRRRFLEER